MHRVSPHRDPVTRCAWQLPSDPSNCQLLELSETRKGSDILMKTSINYLSRILNFALNSYLTKLSSPDENYVKCSSIKIQYFRPKTHKKRWDRYALHALPWACPPSPFIFFFTLTFVSQNHVLYSVV